MGGPFGRRGRASGAEAVAVVAVVVGAVVVGAVVVRRAVGEAAAARREADHRAAARAAEGERRSPWARATSRTIDRPRPEPGRERASAAR